MATPYVHGPCHVYVGVNEDGSAAYLGTCEVSPIIKIEPMWEPFYNDIGGKVPFDMVFMGEEAHVGGVFNRFNEGTYAALASRPDVLGVHGTNVPGDIGTLMLAEDQAFELWLLFPYAAKSFYANLPIAPINQQPPFGYHFWAAYLEGPDTLKPLGTTPTQRDLVFHCLRAFGQTAISTPDPSNNSLLANFYLYDTLAASFANLPAPS